MKKRSNGFTLIEVMVAVLILGVIATISFAIYNTTQEKSKEKLYQTKIDLIKSSAEKWAESVNLSAAITISVNRLVTDGFLESDNTNDEVLNPVNNKVLNCNLVYIEYQNNNAIAEYLEVNDCDFVSQEENDPLITVKATEILNEQIEIANKNGILDWTKENVRLTMSVAGEYIDNYSRILWYQNGSLIEGENQDFLDIEVSLFLNSIFRVTIEVPDKGMKSTNIQVRIDKEEATIYDTTWNDNWENTPTKKVSVQASDNQGSGVAAYYLTDTNALPNNAVWKTIESAQELTIEVAAPKGTSYIWVRDLAGNVSSLPKSFTITTLDTTLPDLSATFTTKSSQEGNTYLSQLVRSITASDTESGIGKVNYCFATGSSCTPDKEYSFVSGTNTAIIDINFDSNKSAQRVCVKVTDVAGNEKTLCDNTTFLVDKTGAMNVSLNYDDNIPKKVIVSANDDESGIWKYVCSYGTSSANLNKNVTVTTSATSATCNLTEAEAGVTYAKVTAYNNAGLVVSSSLSTINWNFTSESVYTDICGNGTYCSTPFYVKFRSARNASYNTYVVYSKGRGTGYRAILNGTYSQTEFAELACCDNGTCTYNNNEFTKTAIGTLINSSFAGALPSNYSSYINYATWDTGYISAAAYSRSSTAYIGLASYADWNNMKNNAVFNENTNNKPYWLSNLVQNYCDYGTSHFCQSTLAVGILVAKYNNGVSSTLYLLPNAAETEQYSYAGMDVFARPVIELKKDIIFTGGLGTKTNPYIIG